MSDFIDELVIVNIFSRLPVESILPCRCVCKRWRDLLHEPYFAQIHTARTTLQQPQQQQQQQQIVSFFMLVNIPETNNYEFHLQDYYVDYSDEKEGYDDDDDDYDEYNMVSRPLQSPQGLISDIYTTDNNNNGNVKWFIMGSVNGLIALYGCTPEDHGPISIIIYNPITKEYLNVPTDDDEAFCSIKDGRLMANGFGYNPKTNEYKIVRIIHQGSPECYVRWIQVYTLGGSGSGGGKWRITKSEGKFPNYVHRTGVSFEGAIYWLSGSSTLIFFDLEDEMLGLVLHRSRNKHLHYELRVFAEYLCVIAECSYTSIVDIWIVDMDNNSIRNINPRLPINRECYFPRVNINPRLPINRECVVNINPRLPINRECYFPRVKIPERPMPSSARFQYTVPIALTRKSRVLCLFDRRSLVSFDPQTETWESLGDIPMFEGSFCIVSYTKSLVSLKALGEVDAKIIVRQPATSENKRRRSINMKIEEDAKIIERQPATKKKRRRSINMKTQLIKLFTSLLLNV